MRQPEAAEPVSPLLVLAFVCELAMLAGLAMVGAGLGSGVAASVGFAIAFPLAVALFWAALLAPRATHRLPHIPRMAAKLVLFIGTGIGLAGVGYPAVGVALAVLATVSLLAANRRSDMV